MKNTKKIKEVKCTCDPPMNEETIAEIGHFLDCPMCPKKAEVEITKDNWEENYPIPQSSDWKELIKDILEALYKWGTHNSDIRLLQPQKDELTIADTISKIENLLSIAKKEERQRIIEIINKIKEVYVDTSLDQEEYDLMEKILDKKAAEKEADIIRRIRGNIERFCEDIIKIITNNQ